MPVVQCPHSHFFLPHLHHQFPFTAVSPSAASTFLKHPSNCPNLILPSFFIKSFIARSKLNKSFANSNLSFLLPLFYSMSMKQQPANCQEAHMLWDLDDQLYFLGNVTLCEAKLTQIFKSKVPSGTLRQRCQVKGQKENRITEFPELEVTQKDHWSPTPVGHSPKQTTAWVYVGSLGTLQTDRAIIGRFSNSRPFFVHLSHGFSMDSHS